LFEFVLRKVLCIEEHFLVFQIIIQEREPRVIHVHLQLSSIGIYSFQTFWQLLIASVIHKRNIIVARVLIYRLINCKRQKDMGVSSVYPRVGITIYRETGPWWPRDDCFDLFDDKKDDLTHFTPGDKVSLNSFYLIFWSYYLLILFIFSMILLLTNCQLLLYFY